MDIAEKQKKTAKPEEKPESPPISEIEWKGPEYEYVPKPNNWFWSAGIIAASIAFASALLGNFLFAILVITGGFAVILFGARKPTEVSFSLSPRGFKIGKRLFPYENLRSFWIHYDPPHKKILIIEPKRFLMSVISAPIANINPSQIREYLLKFLKEERNEESLVSSIIRLIGF